MKKTFPVHTHPCLKGHHTYIQDESLNELPAITDQIVEAIRSEDSPDHIGFPMIPSQESLKEIVQLFETLMFPGYFGRQELDPENVHYYIGDTLNSFHRILSAQIFKCFQHECSAVAQECRDCLTTSRSTTITILKKLPELRRKLAGDIRAAFDGDPAAKNIEEIIFCYPGLKAITTYRFAHELHVLKVPILPRMLTENAHGITGCDIHPGATIGLDFFIDHGTGVVIGETSIIGNNVRIYQGVTLGGLNFPKDEHGQLIRDRKRHPTIEDDVIIYANATILGAETTVGKGSIIGGNVWLTHSVPPHTKVTVEPGHHKITNMMEKN